MGKEKTFINPKDNTNEKLKEPQAIVFRNNFTLPVFSKVDNTLKVASGI